MIITEKKRIKVDRDCKDFPVYVTWLNSLGGYSYWLFFKDHNIKTKTRSETVYSINIEDLETAIGSNDMIGKESVDSLEVGASVNIDSMDGIAGLYQSPKVLMLANPDTWETEGVKWKRVLVKTGSLLILQTKKSFYEVKMTLDLPAINTQKE